MSSDDSLQDDTALRATLIPRRDFSVIEPPHFAAKLLESDAVKRERLLVAYALFADLLNLESHTGSDRVGVWHSMEGLAELLDVACDVADINPFDKKLWLQALGEFKADLRRHDGEAMHRKPALKKHNIIAFYLEETRKQVMAVADPEEVPNRWRQLCVAGYYATRIAVDDHSARDAGKEWSRALEAARAIHLAILHLSVEAWSDGDYRTRLDAGAVVEAFSRSYVQKELSWSTAKHRRRVSIRLLQGKRYRYRRTGKRNKGDSDGSDSSFDLEGVGQDQWTDQKQEQIDEAASPDEFEPPEDVPTERASPPGSANNAHGLYPAGETPSWARSRMTAETLGVTLAWLKQRAKQNPNDLRLRLIHTFVYLQVAYGFKTKDLLDARHGGEASGKSKGREKKGKSQSIVFDNDSFHISPHRQDAKPSFGMPFDEPNLYLPSSHTLTLPAPKSIASVLASLHDAEIPAWIKLTYLFLFRDDKGRWRPLDKETINAELKAISKTIGEPVDVDRIGRSAATLLIEYGGMNELTAAFACGHIPRHLASQAFYTNLRYAEIEQAHTQAARKLFMHIGDVSQAWVTHLGIAPLSVAAPKRDTEQEVTADSLATNDVHTTYRVGSPFVPQVEAVRGYLKGLRQSLNEGGDWRMCFNRFTAYSTLALMFLTGLRPVELRYLTHTRLALDNAQPTLAVMAKMNQSFSEWRTLELAPLITRQLAAYKCHAKRVQKKLTLEYGRNFSEVEEKSQNALFFFVRKSYLPLPVKPTTLKEHLRDNNLEIDDFEWKTNAPRHNYRSTAMRLGIPGKTIDALMGHLTRGRESLGRFSMHDRADERYFAELLATHIADELTIEFAEPTWW